MWSCKNKYCMELSGFAYQGIADSREDVAHYSRPLVDEFKGGGGRESHNGDEGRKKKLNRVHYPLLLNKTFFR